MTYMFQRFAVHYPRLNGSEIFLVLIPTFLSKLRSFANAYFRLFCCLYSTVSIWGKMGGKDGKGALALVLDSTASIDGGRIRGDWMYISFTGTVFSCRPGPIRKRLRGSGVGRGQGDHMAAVTHWNVMFNEGERSLERRRGAKMWTALEVHLNLVETTNQILMTTSLAHLIPTNCVLCSGIFM